MSLIRIKGVVEATSLSRATIYAKIRAREFPCAVKLGKRAVAWKRSDIIEWVNSRPQSQSEVR